MENKELDKLKYPIGNFITPEHITEQDLKSYIRTIEEFPALLKNLVKDFSEEQLNTPYRPKGWTVKQVIHHVADSHMNAYIRFKLALTEDMPTIKAYYEDKWAELGDYKLTSHKISLDLLEALHIKWINLLKSMSKKDFEKSYFHPEYGKEFQLDEIAAMYSWHCNHHYAHINELKKRMKK